MEAIGARDSLRERVVFSADRYDGNDPEASPEAVFLRDSLSVILLSTVDVGDLLAAVCCLEPPFRLTPSFLTSVRVDVYLVKTVSDQCLSLEYLNYFGRQRLQDSNIMLIKDMVDISPAPLRILRVRGLLRDEIMRGRSTTAAPHPHRETDPTHLGKRHMIDNFTGKLVHVTDRSNLGERLEGSRLIRRIASSDVIARVLKEDITFDASRGWGELVREGNFRLSPISVGEAVRHFLPGTQKWGAVCNLPAANSHYYGLLMGGGWNGEGGVQWGVLSLQHFLTVPLRCDRLEQYAAKRAIGDALRGLEDMLVFCCGIHFVDSMATTRSRLEVGDLAPFDVPAAYCRFEIERALLAFFMEFKNLTHQQMCQLYPERDFTSAEGAGVHLTHFMAALVPSAAAMSSFRDRTAGLISYTDPFVASKSFNRTPSSSAQVQWPSSKKPVQVPVRDNGSRPPITGKASRPPCKASLLHHLAVPNSFGKIFRDCTYPSCQFEHGVLEGRSKAEIHSMVDGMVHSGALRGDLIKSVRTAVSARP
jgi:hypothetical protein